MAPTAATSEVVAHDVEGGRRVTLQKDRYLTADHKCFTVTGSLIWRSLAKVRSTDGEIDEHLQGAADSALYVLASKQTGQELTAGRLSGLAARIVAGMASDAETVQVEVARLTIDSLAWCAYELRTLRVPEVKYLTSDKKCVAVAASVIWDPARRNFLYREHNFPLLEERLRDQVGAELRLETSRRSRAETLELDNKKLAAAIRTSIMKWKSAPPSLRTVRIDRIRACTFGE